ncbi:hypothetical protein GGQ84_001584 [Desulfitispora alkaliphila]|uniref:HD family phosphohydrolase n=1 Tax=Desulfitispora alkaliphila TaxID=622674 RepID=UPI003D22521E
MVKNNFKRKVQVPVLRAFKNITFRKVLWGLIFFIVTTGVVAMNYVPNAVTLEEGQVSPTTIKSPRALTFESEVKTSRAREEAIKEVEPVFKVDKTVLQELNEDISEQFNMFVEIIDNEELTQQEKIEAAQEELTLEIPANDLSQLLSIEVEEVKAMETAVLAIVENNMANGIQKEALPTTVNTITNDISTLPRHQGLIQLSLRIVDNVEFKPNLVYDPQATQAKIEIIRSEVAPVQVTIRQGEKIVGEGEVVTAVDIEVLERLGLQQSTRSPAGTFMGIALLVLITYTVVMIYLWQYKPEIYKSESSLVLTGLLIVLTLLFAKVVTLINFGGNPEMSMQVGYMIPLAAGSMLIAILLDNKLAVFLTGIMSILIGILTGGQLSFAIASGLGGLVGVYSVSKLSGRSDLVKAGLYVAGITMITVLAIGLMNNSSPTLITLGMLMGLVNGLLSSVLTIGLLPFLETAFGITTSVRLLELSNPNHPLLKRLLIEAPGTYHHSILAGNLAEAAADAVNADSLLVRVGAYYHDIGKLKRPYFFIENQLAGDNPHNKLAPTLSTLIITSHVKDGVELAKEHQLPKVIVDLIHQHHGKSILGFFYHKATEENKGDTVQEKDFRYEAPRPETKEAALVMLADSVEAAVRSMQNPTPGRVEGLVRKIIKDKLNDGQLDKCNLTLKDLDVISAEFVKVLGGIFHSRIEYPETIAKEMEGNQ